MKKYILTICCLLLALEMQAQKTNPKYNFNHEVSRAKGDLNKDNIEDLAIVTQDTAAEHAPYKLDIYFGQPGAAKPKLIISTTKAIDPLYQEGRNGWATGTEFYEVSIINNVLTLSVQLLRGTYHHKFRYQNGNFELIGFTEASSDGHGVSTTTDFNLSTGIRIVKEERYDTDKVLSNTKKKIVVRPLPKLQDFKPYDTDLY